MVPCICTPWYHLFYFRKVIMISFKYENNGLNDEQLNELNKFLNDNIKSIMDFFNFDKNIIITIKIFECKDNLDNYVLNHMGNKLKD